MAATARPVSDLLRSVEWRGGLEDGRLALVNADALPATVAWDELRGLDAVCAALTRPGMAGTLPAVLAAYGVVLAAVPVAGAAPLGKPSEVIHQPVLAAIQRLSGCRPAQPAVVKALERMRVCCERHLGQLTALELCARLLMEARRIQREDAEAGVRLAEHGIALLPERGGVLTHGASGACASGGGGTAQACILAALAAGRQLQVTVADDGPAAVGAHLAMAELRRAGVPATLAATAVGTLFAQKRIQAVIIGSCCVCGNGDCLAASGAYTLAVLAKHHGVPFLVAATAAAIDAARGDGRGLNVGSGDADRLRAAAGVAADVPVWHPAGEVVPAALITALITDRGVAKPPQTATIHAFADAPGM